MGNWKDTSEEDKKKFSDNGYAITYGELTLDGLTKIMNHDLDDPNDLNDKVFVDLGSGNGNVVINVIKNFEGLYKGIGIELSKTRYNTAIEKLKGESKEIQKKIHFSCNDILDDGFHYSDFDIIYISNLCFSDEVNKKITNKITSECKENTRIFCSKQLIGIEPDGVFDVKQTWTNKSNINYYKIKK
uniref:Histone-lysine N-methyltransferase, H3 lysine-79 specific n=1 Tax=viral metagenome TaxID=1070528 RepID=A0A6C0BUG4_9ZZZZ